MELDRNNWRLFFGKGCDCRGLSIQVRSRYTLQWTDSKITRLDWNMKIQGVVTSENPAFCSWLRTFSLASFDSPVSYHDASSERVFAANADWICHPCNVLIKAPQKSKLRWGKLVHLRQEATRWSTQHANFAHHFKVSPHMQSFTAWTCPTNFHVSWSSKANGWQIVIYIYHGLALWNKAPSSTAASQSNMAPHFSCDHTWQARTLFLKKAGSKTAAVGQGQGIAFLDVFTPQHYLYIIYIYIIYILLYIYILII